MAGLMNDFWGNESGASAIEYGLLAAILGIGLVFSLSNLEDALSRLFESVRDQVPN